MKAWRVLDLFSGIGGCALGLQRAGMTIAQFVEINRFCRAILATHWPDVPCHADVRTFRAELGCFDIVAGGYPCQPYSVAGLQHGAKDHRNLWPEMLRIVDEARPRWVIGENTFGHVALELDNVLSDLEILDYTPQAFVIPACAVDAKHKRERVFVIARRRHDGYRPDGGDWFCLECGRAIFDGCECDHGEWQCRDCGEWSYPFHHSFADGCTHCGSGAVAYAERERGRSGRDERKNAIDADDASKDRRRDYARWPVEPDVGRVADGISDGLARTKLRALGNAVVPQLIETLGRSIIEAEDMTP